MTSFSGFCAVGADCDAVVPAARGGVEGGEDSAARARAACRCTTPSSMALMNRRRASPNWRAAAISLSVGGMVDLQMGFFIRERIKLTARLFPPRGRDQLPPRKYLSRCICMHSFRPVAFCAAEQRWRRVAATGRVAATRANVSRPWRFGLAGHDLPDPIELSDDALGNIGRTRPDGREMLGMSARRERQDQHIARGEARIVAERQRRVTDSVGRPVIGLVVRRGVAAHRRWQ